MLLLVCFNLFCRRCLGFPSRSCFRVLFFSNIGSICFVSDRDFDFSVFRHQFCLWGHGRHSIGFRSGAKRPPFAAKERFMFVSVSSAPFKEGEGFGFAVHKPKFCGIEKDEHCSRGSFHRIDDWLAWRFQKVGCSHRQKVQGIFTGRDVFICLKFQEDAEVRGTWFGSNSFCILCSRLASLFLSCVASKNLPS